MVNRSRSGLAHLERPSFSKEFVHMDQRVRFEVYKENQWQPSLPPQGEGTATNTKGMSYYNRDGEVDRLRKQVALLQRNAEKDKELLWRKDKSFMIGEGQARHPVTPEHMNTFWTTGMGSVIGDHLLPMECESSLYTGKGLSLHLTTRIEGESKTRRSIKDQFLRPR